MVTKLEALLKEGEDAHDALKLENESLETQSKSLLKVIYGSVYGPVIRNRI